MMKRSGDGKLQNLNLDASRKRKMKKWTTSTIRYSLETSKQ